ncbi:hypothetical protein CBU03nite_20140 [Clostridium butyricum]|uniref:Uncharacterized protein n=1 Tax=Clostridium butyricum TaxID=1492 RepID=A0AAP9RFX7_CLOBU|nr:hypothetical protein [Clostridium butyricum]EMU55317.1 hypothetical protein CBDKU1_07430 [Clostridium butyricum DKU-01]MBZ0314308.1 hypothetical protein [Clostridium butyricum]NFB72568.1 hypothetical protein [Clostridium butyricum]NFB91350.1 hypothetical protein [Clostridium butyricum]QGH21913.1 hypothetical protein EBL75_10175 [Clostridium butyricum]
MIIINTLEDIEIAEITPLELKEEILQHFQEIAESVVDKYWKMYNLKEVGDIVLLEDDDSIEVINRYNIIDKQSKKLTSIPEFTEIIVIDDVEIMKTTFILGDSFGITLYHKSDKLGRENEDFLKEYKI